MLPLLPLLLLGANSGGEARSRSLPRLRCAPDEASKVRVSYTYLTGTYMYLYPCRQLCIIATVIKLTGNRIQVDYSARRLKAEQINLIVGECTRYYSCLSASTAHHTSLYYAPNSSNSSSSLQRVAVCCYATLQPLLALQLLQNITWRLFLGLL